MCITEEQRHERALMLLNQEKGNTPSQWWMSFCDPDKPTGQQFLGVLVIEAIGFMHAVQLSWTLGLNPGGEVIAGQVEGVPSEYHNRLLSKQEIEDAGLL